ncbi:putative hsp70 protein [Rosellinia necatrix]|uniref:Putative hsp70 protein n=1 Tax=Rosellinia necatrix TaxID=77044 RepID=A0A1S8A5K2_ROSNE|nr:putative hsp70 protein [Rosellinia necatrix]
MHPLISQYVQRRLDLGKTVLTVLTDFLTRLWQACKPQILQDGLGMSWRLVITHPAGWSVEKLEQAIDAAILTPDQGNITYTVCFQTEAQAALMGELAAQGMQLAYDSNSPTGQGARAQDNEAILIADFGGLTVDIASGSFNAQTGTASVVWQVAPTSSICGTLVFDDVFASLLETKAEMLLQKPLTPDWFHNALSDWNNQIFPKLSTRSRIDSTWHVPQEDFKDSVRIPYYRWVKKEEFPIHL